MVRAFAVHNLQNVGQAGFFPIGRHPLEYRLLPGGFPGVGVGDIISCYPAAGIHLHAVKNTVAVGRFPLGLAQGEQAAGVGRAHPVRLHNVQPQGVGHKERWLAALN